MDTDFEELGDWRLGFVGEGGSERQVFLKWRSALAI